MTDIAPGATSQNGWSVLDYGSSRLRQFVVPAKTGSFKITLRDGSAGFLLVHFLLWWAEVIEPLAGKLLDDWGHGIRPIRGQLFGYSNHASGTAADANATQHPLGTRTLTTKEKALILARLLVYRGCLRSGAFYSGRVDEMHTEINKGLADCEKRARALTTSPRGKRILEANPGLLRVINS